MLRGDDVFALSLPFGFSVGLCVGVYGSKTFEPWYKFECVYLFKKSSPIYFTLRIRA